ncbi:unnamed protein product [Schistosoma turkestanicum]|nr:unnamed protein product [Schistosoma turkestanicum]
MEEIHNTHYQQKLRLSQQSYLESIIEKYFFTTNDSGEEDNISLTTTLPLSLSNVNPNYYSMIQQHCVPLIQNDYSNLDSSSIQSNNYSFMNEVNHSVHHHSNANDIYTTTTNINNNITSTNIVTDTTTIATNSHHNNNDNHQNYHASTSTPRFIHDSKWDDRNNRYTIDNSSFYTETSSPLLLSALTSSSSSSMISPCSMIRTTNENQIDQIHTSYLPKKLIKSFNKNLSQQINTVIDLTQNYIEDSPIVQNNPNNNNSKYRRNPIKRKQHQREQDKNRTKTLNTAFCRLRSCLPEIPKDTKLTKIRTLRYAITYIRQLIDLINQTDPVNSHAIMFDTGSNSLKMESELEQSSLMKDSGYLSFMDR